MFADVDELSKDPNHHRVFTWTDTSTNPDSNPEFLDKRADWIVSEAGPLLTLKNVRFNEYLYVAAEANNQPGEVFTKNEIDTESHEGSWAVTADLRGNCNKHAYKSIDVKVIEPNKNRQCST